MSASARPSSRLRRKHPAQTGSNSDAPNLLPSTPAGALKARRHVSGRMYVTGIAGAVTAYPKRAMPNIAKDVAMLREVLVSPERRDGSKAIAAKRGLLALAV